MPYFFDPMKAQSTGVMPPIPHLSDTPLAKEKVKLLYIPGTLEDFEQ